MKSILLAVISLILAVFLFPASTLAQASKYYDPPLSFTGGDLTGRDFSGRTLQAAELALAHGEYRNF